MIQLAVLLTLLLVCSTAPGFCFVRKLRWSPLEKLCGAIGLSLILVYLASTALYWLNLRGPWVFRAAAAICLILGGLARRDV